jgi:hypothetical protein
MQDQKLFLGAPVVIHLHASFEPGQGWSLSANMRRDYQEWDEVRADEYSGLSTSELLDVLIAVSERSLDL